MIAFQVSFKGKDYNGRRIFYISTGSKEGCVCLESPLGEVIHKPLSGLIIAGTTDNREVKVENDRLYVRGKNDEWIEWCREYKKPGKGKKVFEM